MKKSYFFLFFVKISKKVLESSHFAAFCLLHEQKAYAKTLSLRTSLVNDAPHGKGKHRRELARAAPRRI